MSLYRTARWHADRYFCAYSHVVYGYSTVRIQAGTQRSFLRGFVITQPVYYHTVIVRRPIIAAFNPDVNAKAHTRKHGAPHKRQLKERRATSNP